MNRERLQRVVDLMRTINPAEFNIESWKCEKEQGCGTTACAVGWAASTPGFIEEGFHLEQRTYADGTACGSPQPVFEGLWGFDAVEEFFGIKEVRVGGFDYYYEHETTVTLSEYLFHPDYYPNLCQTTPNEVADRIEAYLREHA